MYLRPLQKPYPPLWYMRNPVTAAMEGMHTIIVGSLDGLAVAVPRYRAAWEEHQGANGLTAQGDEPMIGLVVHLVVAETNEEAMEAAKPAWEKYRWNLAAPRRLEAEKRGLTQFQSTKDGSFGFVGDRPAGLPTRETRRDIDAELERFDQQRRGRASQPAGRRGAGRHARRRPRVHGRVPRHRRQLLRLLVPVGRPQPRPGDALDRAVRDRSDAQVHNARDHSARVASVSRSATAPPGRDEHPGGLGAISGPPCKEIGMNTQAAVFRKVQEPLTVESVEIDKPWGREVLVRTAATGVCHSDLHVVDGIGRFPLDRPIVLGHEGAGVVESVGADVTTVKPGDHVVACLSGFCGNCAQCLSGHPNLCVGGIVTRPESAAPRLSQKGAPFRQFIGISSYAEHMLLHENSLVKIDADLPLDRAALVGCGVLTGVGAALRTSGLQAGQTVAVFGCGGVGLAIVQGARIGGASRIIGVDMFDGKLEMAKRVGATHVVNSAKDDPVKAIRALTGGAGVDHSFEAVGNAKLVRQAIESLAIRGTATIVGVLPPDATIEFPWMAIRPECKVQTSRMGSNQFRTDIPRYLDFYRQGRLHARRDGHPPRHAGRHQRGLPRHEGRRSRADGADLRLIAAPGHVR